MTRGEIIEGMARAVAIAKYGRPTEKLPTTHRELLELDAERALIWLEAQGIVREGEG